jgi:hypothetical protein
MTTNEISIRTGGPSRASGQLVLADISGYTSFLRAVQDAHRDDAFAGDTIPPAYSLVSSLLDGIVEAVAPPFTLSKLEGDAVFAWADDAVAPHGRALLDCLARCYGEFRGRLEQVGDVWTCRCDACRRVDTLDLKFIVHAGPFVIESIAGRTELVGPDVVMAHRLLKTGAAALVGHGGYAVVTDAAVRRYEVPTDGSLPLVEAYEHYAPVDLHVFALADLTAREPAA